MMKDTLPERKMTKGPLLAVLLMFCGLMVWGDAYAASPRGLTVLAVVGEPGEDEYAKRFDEELEHWTKACATGGATLHVIGKSDAGQPDVQELQQWLQRFIKESQDPLWVVFIGHGTFDGREARFNLKGADFTVGEFATWLQSLKRPLAVINTASASGPFLKTLSGPDRVVITATKSADEVFTTRFGGYFAKAIAGEKAADQDGDAQISLLEAFLWASGQVAKFYEAEDRLATEHTMLEDTGDGVAVRPDDFEGLRYKGQKPDAKSPDEGLRSRQWSLILNEAESRLPEAVRQRRDELEREVASLRSQKDGMDAKAYYDRLEQIFLELGRLYRERAD